MEYFLELVKINSNYNEFYDKIRIKDENELNIIYSRMNSFYTNKFDLDSFLNLCCYLFNRQIFTDGNSRTIFEYMKNELSNNGYSINFDDIKKDYSHLRSFFPLMYDMNESLAKRDLIKLKKYIRLNKDTNIRK